MIANAIGIREEKGKLIANKQGFIYRVDDTKYKVKSQSGNGFYDVEETKIGWKCNCQDHKCRGAKCKHIWAVEVYVGMRHQAKPKILQLNK
jgi:putative transposase